MMFNNIKIAQFIKDDKFTDSAFNLFETVAPGCTDYYFASRDKSLRYVKDVPVIFINRFAFKNPFFMRTLEKYDFIILHALTPFNQALVSHSKGKLKFVWIGMGYDYYDLIFDSKEELFLNKTKEIAIKYDNEVRQKKSWWRAYLKEKIYKNRCKKEIVKQISYFSPVLETEYSMVCDKLDSKCPKYVKWNYAITAKLVDNGSNNIVRGQDILLGNSATLTNNHIEVMEFLKQIDLKGKKIICPLNYGIDQYGDYIAGRGLDNFGEDFVGIREFMSYEDYTETINSCSNVIMNHLRQQAGGNIAMMLFLGAKVFLNKVNPFYDHYIMHGLKLFTMEQLYSNPEILDMSLSVEDVESNRSILKNLSCKQAQIDKTTNLISQVQVNL